MRRAPGLILTYHRVTTLKRDPLAMAVTPERFEAHLRVLRKLADCVPLSEVGTRPERTIAVTLDDGYADSVEIANSLLEHAGVPATLFITSNVLDVDREFWWDQLEHVLLDADGRADVLRLEIAGRPLLVDVRTPEGRGRALRALNHRLRPLPTGDLERHLREVAEQMGGGHDVVCPDHRRLSPDQVLALGHGAALEVGGHTRTHTMLSALTRDEQRDEIAGSREYLTAVAGRTVDNFAYPFGFPGSFDATTVDVVREAGYARACINTGGLVDRRSDPFLLPRHPTRDVPAEELRGQVERWFEQG